MWELGGHVDALAVGGPEGAPQSFLAVGVSYMSGQWWTGEVRVLDPTSGASSASADAEGVARGALRAGVPSVAWVGGDVMTGGDDGCIDRWQLSLPGQGSPAGELQRVDGVEAHEGAVSALAPQPGAAFFASAGADGSVCIWDGNQQLKSPLAELAGHTGAVEGLSWGAGADPQLASSSVDGTVRVWDSETSAPALTIGVSSPAYCVAWSPSSPGVLACGTENGLVETYDTRAPPSAPVASVKAHGDVVRAVAFGAGGLASAGDDGSICLHGAAAAGDKPAARVTPHAQGAYVRALSWAGGTGSSTLFSGGWDGSVASIDTKGLLTES